MALKIHQNTGHWIILLIYVAPIQYCRSQIIQMPITNHLLNLPSLGSGFLFSYPCIEPAIISMKAPHQYQTAT